MILLASPSLLLLISLSFSLHHHYQHIPQGIINILYLTVISSTNVTPNDLIAVIIIINITSTAAENIYYINNTLVVTTNVYIILYFLFGIHIACCIVIIFLDISANFSLSLSSLWGHDKSDSIKPVLSARLYLVLDVLFDIYCLCTSILLKLSLHTYVCMLRMQWYDCLLALALIH